MEVGIDEARNHRLARDVDLAAAGIVPEGTADTVTGDGDVGQDEIAAHQVEEPSALQHEVGWFLSLALKNGVLKLCAHQTYSVVLMPSRGRTQRSIMTTH